MKIRCLKIDQVEVRGDLLIPNVALTDEGTYSCRGDNSVGSRQMDVQLRVRQPPRFEQKPKNQTIRVGQEAVFDCKMLGIVPNLPKYDQDFKNIESFMSKHFFS